MKFDNENKGKAGSAEPNKKNPELSGASNGGLPGVPEKDPSFNIGDLFVILASDSEQYGSGKVMIKTGPDKKDWLRMTYIDTGKLFGTIRIHKDHFNKQLQKEKKLLGLVEDLV